MTLNLTSSCFSVALLDGATLSVNSTQSGPGTFTVEVCPGTTEIEIFRYGFDDALVTIPNPVPEELEVQLNCTGILFCFIKRLF